MVVNRRLALSLNQPSRRRRARDARSPQLAGHQRGDARSLRSSGNATTIGDRREPIHARTAMTITTREPAVRVAPGYRHARQSPRMSTPKGSRIVAEIVTSISSRSSLPRERFHAPVGKAGASRPRISAAMRRSPERSQHRIHRRNPQETADRVTHASRWPVARATGGHRRPPTRSSRIALVRRQRTRRRGIRRAIETWPAVRIAGRAPAAMNTRVARAGCRW